MIAGSNVCSSTKMCICAGTHRDLSNIPTAKDIYALIAACLWKGIDGVGGVGRRVVAPETPDEQ